jgi:DnaJ family protein C protein 28
MSTLPFLDEIIRAALNRGEFRDLPGEGKPLDLTEDPHTPEHLRLAHKILKDNDLVPEWIADAREVDAARAAWIEALRSAWRTGRWPAERERLEAEARQINRRILTFNLKAPRGIPHRHLIDVAREVKRLRPPGAPTGGG